MARRIASVGNEVPYRSKEDLQQEAALLLAEYSQHFPPVLAPPVPVEEILELFLKLTFEISDLKALFGFGDVLGAIWINEKIVRVDTNLDPSANGKMLGRYRFTLAHEAAHWRLHRPYFLEHAEQNKMFTADGKVVCVCRASEATKKPVEWQADYFAAHLLMPTNMLLAAWQQWRKKPDPVYLEDIWDQFGEETVREEVGQRKNAARADSCTAANAVMDMFVRPIASTFEVSAEAMRIRLEEVGLMQRQREQALF